MIKFLKPNFPPIHSYILDFYKIYKNGQYTNNGPYVRKFENKLKEYLQSEITPVVVNNATTGLIIALKALDLPKGSKIIVPSFTFAATIQAILWCDLVPVFCDINISSFNMCQHETSILLKETANVSAIMPINCFGNLIDYQNFIKLKNKHKVKLIVDSAESIGATVSADSSHVDAEIYSFHATKLLTVGEGGCVVFADRKHESLARKMIDFGFGSERSSETIGLNGKMTEFSAAIGLKSIEKLNVCVSRRHDILKEYEKIFCEVGISLKIRTQSIDFDSSLQILGIVCNEKELKTKLEYLLNSNGVETREYFNPPCHKMPFFLEFDSGTYLRNTEYISERIISLPIWDTMGNKELRKINNILRSL